MPAFTEELSLTSTICDELRKHAESQPDATAFTFLPDGDKPPQTISFAELLHQAERISFNLTARGLSGHPVILAYPSGLPYIAAFMGCLYAGAIAVPLYPPQTHRHDPRFDAIVRDSMASLILCPDSIHSAREDPEAVRLPVVSIEDLLQTDDVESDHLESDPILIRRNFTAELDTPAFIQYTSGSTASPKGVIVRHRNIVANVHAIHSTFEVKADSTAVSWLPFFHDMGLIGVILQTIVGGSHSVLLSPVSFLKKPVRWLKAISDYKASNTIGPDFGYDLCARKVTDDQLASLDLSRWATAITGAEPVRRKTIDAFSERFAPAGFRRTAFCPAYGLAEATLLVSALRPSEPPRFTDTSSADSRTSAVTSCGRPSDGVIIRIVDPDSGHTLPEETPGEIWVGGPSVSSGYWENLEASASAFGATLEGDENQTYLRTGDIGFLFGGELYVTGRIKDLIVIRGQNHHPTDLEQTVEHAHPAVKPHGCAAFSIEAEEEERLIVVLELNAADRNADRANISGKIAEALWNGHGLRPFEIVYCASGGIPRTTSGKPIRSRCKQMYQQCELHLLSGGASANKPN